MKTKPMSEMTTEHAGYILRRTPATPWEQSLAREAVRTLVKAGECVETIETTAMRCLTQDELAVYHEMRLALSFEAPECDW